MLVLHALERALEQSLQHRKFERLFDVPVGARFDGLHDSFVAAASRDDNHRNLLDFLDEMAQQLQSVHPGKLDVGQDHIRRKFGKSGEGVFALPTPSTS